MHRVFIWLVCLISLSLHVKAQAAYRDYVTTDRFIITTSGGKLLNVYDRSNGQKLDTNIKCPSGVTLFTKDRHSNPVVVDNRGYVKRFDPSSESWKLMTKTINPVWGIAWTSTDECFIITATGIMSIQTGKRYYTDSSLNSQLHYHGKWSKPYCYFMDSHDRLWVGFGYGEWGGNLFIFETGSKRFVKPELSGFDIELSPVKSFFEDRQYLYMTTGLSHMLTSGAILRFKGSSANILLESKSHWDDKDTSFGKVKFRKMIEAEYIGPGTYDRMDSSIYFYSQNGIHHGKIGEDLSLAENWKVVIKPKLKWTDGQPDAVGSPMNVIKMDAIGNGKIVFLSQNDGIGYFDGKRILMLE